MKKILIIDDSETALFDIRRKIEEASPKSSVVTASNYEDALAILQTEALHMAIIDLQMPDKNGADLIVHMKSKDQLKGIPIVVLTSTGSDSLLKTSLVDMVNHYIPKPISQQQILDLLTEFS